VARTSRGRQGRTSARFLGEFERLEGRQLLSSGDSLGLPLIFLDIPGSASTSVVSATVKRLDIKASVSSVSNTTAATDVLAKPLITEVSLLVNNNGTLNGGVAGDDLRIYQDNDLSGGFSAGDTILCTGEVRNDGSFSVAGVTLEAVFALNSGTPWASDPLHFAGPGGQPLDAGLHVDLSGPVATPLDFNAGFSGYQPKGLIGSLPRPVPQLPPATICGRVFKRLQRQRVLRRQAGLRYPRRHRNAARRHRRRHPNRHDRRQGLLHLQHPDRGWADSDLHDRRGAVVAAARQFPGWQGQRRHGERKKARPASAD